MKTFKEFLKEDTVSRWKNYDTTKIPVKSHISYDEKQKMYRHEFRDDAGNQWGSETFHKTQERAEKMFKDPHTVLKRNKGDKTSFVFKDKELNEAWIDVEGAKLKRHSEHLSGAIMSQHKDLNEPSNQSISAKSLDDTKKTAEQMLNAEEPWRKSIGKELMDKHSKDKQTFKDFNKRKIGLKSI